jgi:hypothetical protein
MTSVLQVRLAGMIPEIGANEGLIVPTPLAVAIVVVSAWRMTVHLGSAPSDPSAPVALTVVRAKKAVKLYASPAGCGGAVWDREPVRVLAPLRLRRADPIPVLIPGLGLTLPKFCAVSPAAPSLPKIQ